MEQLRHHSRPLLAMLAGGLVVGFVLALATGGSSAGSRDVATVVPLPTTAAPQGAGVGGSTQPAESEGGPATSVGTPAGGSGDAEQVALQRALTRGVAAAGRITGPAEVGVWVDGWSDPVLAGDVDRSMRLWSMSKAVTAVAVLRRQPQPSAELEQALVDALTRSENCPQRRVVMSLQSLAGGAEGARGAFTDTLAAAGASAEVPPPIAPPEPSCQAYLQQHAGELGSHVLDPAYQYGTATWSVRDAVAFAHALGSGEYGQAGARTLELLGRPKAPGREPGAQLSTATTWGVGRSFPGWSTAYKAGWGGAGDGNFLVGQIAVVQRGGHSVAVAAMVHPTQQPSVDDPGLAHASEGLETLLREVSAQLDRTVAG